MLDLNKAIGDIINQMQLRLVPSSDTELISLGNAKKQIAISAADGETILPFKVTTNIGGRIYLNFTSRGSYAAECIFKVYINGNLAHEQGYKYPNDSSTVSVNILIGPVKIEEGETLTATCTRTDKGGGLCSFEGKIGGVYAKIGHDPQDFITIVNN